MNGSGTTVEVGPCVGKPPFMVTLFAPMRVFRPTAACRLLLHSSRSAVIVTLAVYCLLMSLTVLWVIFLAEAGLGATRESASSVLRTWREVGPLGLAPTTVLLTCVLAPSLCAMFALLYLPTTHVQGAVQETLAKNFRAALASAGTVVSLFLVVGSIVAVLSQVDSGNIASGLVALFAGLLLIPISVLTVIVWLSRAMRVVADLHPRPAQTPRCEGCGYDLCYAPTDGRCTECGLSIADSLEGPHRRATAWERSAGLRAWWIVNWDAVFHVRQFYQSLQTRDGLRAARLFIYLNFLMLFVGVWLWLLGLLSKEILKEGGVLFFPHLAASVFIVIAGWSLWRLIALTAVIHWLWQGRLDDARRVHKAAAYETAFLWVYCAFCGTLFTSMVAFDDLWISQLVDDAFGTRIRILGLNMEQLSCFLGVVVLSVVWWVRWQRILAAIRWANK